MRACDKKRYRSGSEARRELDKIRRLGNRTQDGKPQRVYACPFCHGFHLTSWGYGDGR